MTFNVSSVSLQWNGKLCEGNYKAAVDLISYFRPQICRRWVTSVEGAIRLLAFSYPIGSTCNTYWRPTFHRKFLFQKVFLKKVFVLQYPINSTCNARWIQTFHREFLFQKTLSPEGREVAKTMVVMLLGKGENDKRFSYLGKTGKLYLGKDRDWPWRWLSRPTGLPGVKPHHTQDITEMAFWDAFKLQHSDRHFTAVTHLDLLNTV